MVQVTNWSSVIMAKVLSDEDEGLLVLGREEDYV